MLTFWLSSFDLLLSRLPKQLSSGSASPRPHFNSVNSAESHQACGSRNTRSHSECTRSDRHCAVAPRLADSNFPCSAFAVELSLRLIFDFMHDARFYVFRHRPLPARRCNTAQHLARLKRHGGAILLHHRQSRSFFDAHVGREPLGAPQTLTTPTNHKPAIAARLSITLSLSRHSTGKSRGESGRAWNGPNIWAMMANLGQWLVLPKSLRSSSAVRQTPSTHDSTKLAGYLTDSGTVPSDLATPIFPTHG